MEGQGRARGRARGRTSARPVQETLPSPGLGDRRQGSSGTTRSQDVLAGPSQAVQQQQAATHTPAEQFVQARPQEGGAHGGGGKYGPGGSDQPIGRGALRGRRQLPTEMLHTRPDNVISKRGTSGRPIKLMANYFKLCSITDWVVYQYRVDFAPLEEHTGICKALVRIHQDVLGGYIFDGSHIFSSHRYPKDPLELFSTRQGDDEQIRITVRFIKQIESGDAMYLQIFNILMRKSLGRLKLQQVGRNFYDALAKVEVPQFNLELWPGYLTSIRQHESSILMCSEITSKVMRTDTLLDLLRQLQRNCRPEEFQELYKQKVLGLVVLTDYNNRTYRVDDVNYKISPRSTFLMKNGRQISYIEYYRERYQIHIRQDQQPMIVSKCKPREIRSGSTEEVYLVPELCRMTGISDEMHENTQLMRALADHTRVGPSMRVQKLLTFSKRLKNTSEVEQEMKDWNMSISDGLLQFDGRVLGSETIVQGGQDGNFIKYDSGPNVDWTGKLRSNPMLQIAHVNVWVVMVPNDLMRDAEKFVGLIMQAARGMHMRMADPHVVTLSDDRHGTYVNKLEEVLSEENPQLVVCCVSNNKPDRYSAIKKKCCVDRPVPTQVITRRAMTNRGAMSIATKVAIQINCKLGGAPWTVENPISGVMVVARIKR